MNACAETHLLTISADKINWFNACQNMQEASHISRAI